MDELLKDLSIMEEEEKRDDEPEKALAEDGDKKDRKNC